VSTDAETPSPAASTPPAQRAWRGRIAAAVVVALIVFVAVGAAVWFLNSDDSATSTTSSSAPASAAPPVAPRVVSVALLRQFAGAGGRPVYWAGERQGTRIEFTRRVDGATFVRYLTGSARPGNGSARYVVVATYAQPDAYKRVSRVASQRHLAVKPVAGGGIAVARKGRPQNVYVVYPDQPYQVEVYAPTAAAAKDLVFSGAITPVR
jgi:hypothetical protein